MAKKGEYKKRKRASKYDKKLAIDASFEDVIKIALGMSPSILGKRTMTFEKWDTNKGTFDFFKDLGFYYRNYAITFDYTAIEKIGLKITLENNIQQLLGIESMACNCIRENNILRVVEHQVKHFILQPEEKNNQQEQTFFFTEKGIQCNTVFVFCKFSGSNFPSEIKLSAEVFINK